MAIVNFFKSLFKKKEDENISNEHDTIVAENEPINEPISEPINEPISEPINEPNLSQGNGCGIVILIDNGHGKNTPGKKSPYSCYGIKPEIEFFEYKWNREISEKVVENLISLGYDARLVVPEIIDISLKERVNRINTICNEYGASNVLLVSIHANAAGDGKEWLNSRGWSAYTTKGTTKSDIFAEYLYTEAKKNFKGHKVRTDKTDGDSDLESNFYIIYKSFCPAVLTENFFYDNVDDVKYILSDEGHEKVIKTHVDGIINYLKTVKNERNI